MWHATQQPYDHNACTKSAEKDRVRSWNVKTATTVHKFPGNRIKLHINFLPPCVMTQVIGDATYIVLPSDNGLPSLRKTTWCVTDKRHKCAHLFSNHNALQFSCLNSKVTTSCCEVLLCSHFGKRGCFKPQQDFTDSWYCLIIRKTVHLSYLAYGAVNHEWNQDYRQNILS